MGQIKRYDLIGHDADTEEDVDGDWVWYEDHVESIVKLNVELVGMSEEKEYWRTLALQAAQRVR